MINKLLKRQIQKHYSKEGKIPEDFWSLMKVIGESYDHYEKDRKMLERSIDLSSTEMVGLNNLLKKETSQVRKANDELNKIFNTIDESIFSVDITNYKLTHISAACEKIYGYSPEEFYLNQELWQDVIYPEDKSIAHGHMAALERGEHVLNKYRIIHKNKSIRWIENKVIPTMDENNKLTRIDGVTSDITKRKLIEITLQENEEQVHSIFNAVMDAIIVIDEKGDVIKWDSKAESLFGWKENEILGLSLTETIIPVDFREAHKKGFKHYFETGKGQILGKTIELRALKKSNVEFDISLSVSASLIKDKYQFIGFVRDISKRKAVEVSLQKSEANLKNVFENTDTAYVLLDENANILSFNHVALKLAEEVMAEIPEEGKCYIDLMPLRRQKEIREIINNVLNEKKSHSHETKYIRQDNSVLWFLINMHPILNNDKKILGLSVAVTDITERKQSEHETLSLLATLQTKNKDLQQFAYIVSHNLRAPIAKIQGLASLCNPESEDTSLNKTLHENIVSEANNLDTIVKDMNTIISARDSKSMIKESINIKDELLLITQVLEHEISESSAEITTDFNPENIVTVKSYLYSILYNLVSNAIKYRMSGIPLKIQLQTKIKNNFICLSVNDNGSGIDLEKNKEKIFGLYKRFHNGNIPGRGIGLNLVKTHAESLGGYVEIESKINKGSTFKIFLPKKVNQYD